MQWEFNLYFLFFHDNNWKESRLFTSFFDQIHLSCNVVFLFVFSHPCLCALLKTSDLSLFHVHYIYIT